MANGGGATRHPMPEAPIVNGGKLVCIQHYL
jgi:hypothetical protein